MAFDLLPPRAKRPPAPAPARRSVEPTVAPPRAGRTLAVGAADDPAETEATQIADAVVASLSSPHWPGTGSDASDSSPRVRRSATAATPATTAAGRAPIDGQRRVQRASSPTITTSSSPEIIRRDFVELAPMVFVDRDTGTRYEQIEVRVDDRVKVRSATGEEVSLDYVEGAWHRAGTTTKVTTIRAAALICGWLGTEMRKDSNYSVAELGNGDLMVSKVNGVTATTLDQAGLGDFIRTNELHIGRSIHVAQKYNTALGSNHAEMCILAAAKTLNTSVVRVSCTGPNCPYCTVMMAHENVISGNAGQEGKPQQGWAHPWERYFWGSQVANESVTDQTDDLAKYLAGSRPTPTIGSRTTTPSAGRSTVWF